MAFLRGHYEPQSKEESKRMDLRARAYEIRGDNLYKSGVCAPLLKCISIEGQDLLHQIHSGMCSSHIGTRRLVVKAFRQGFYWPTTVRDGEGIVRKCDNCQKHCYYMKTSPYEIQLLPQVCPFARWGII
jgi:hypothetical protein